MKRLRIIPLTGPAVQLSLKVTENSTFDALLSGRQEASIVTINIVSAKTANIRGSSALT